MPDWVNVNNGLQLAGVLFLFFTILSGFFRVHTMEAGVVERLGKFHRIAEPGLNFKMPWIDHLVYTEDLSMQLMDVPVASKTKDDATITIPVRIQYFVLPDKVKDAYYRLDDPDAQIKAHVENVILSYIPKIDLDEAYLQEDKIAQRVKESLTDVMAQFGYAIENALVTKIVPSDAVVNAMNDINAARREQVAQKARAEAQKITLVAQAEASKQTKILEGEGVAGQRKALIDGLRNSVEDFKKAVGVSVEEVLTLVLMTQYFDALKEIGAKSNTILLPVSAAGIGQFLNEFRTTLISGGLAVAAANGHLPARPEANDE